eukprot:407911_1
MPKHKSVLPSPHDIVQCTVCNNTFERRCHTNGSHWRKYKTSYPIHSNDIPMDQRVNEIIPKSNLLAMWKIDDKHTKVARPTPTLTLKNKSKKQVSLIDIYSTIKSNLIEKNKLMQDHEYLIQSIHSKLQIIKKTNNKIDVNAFIENAENEYESSYAILSDIQNTFTQTQTFLENIKRLVAYTEFDVHSFEALLVHFHFWGLRATEHDKCSEGEVLIYCSICCKDPIYPTKDRGSIWSGLIVNIHKYKDNLILWRSTKQICKSHFFFDTGHKMNMECNKNVFANKCFTAKLNQLKICLRLNNSNQSDTQYPLENAMLIGMDVNMGISKL